MKIRRLELQGFKSFVDRSVLTFDHDVTAVVGPNGCGKSNTVDAIRWCMGEQSARHLRGRSMEDVIFNGSDSRPAAPFAEVTLTFDNRDGLAPPEFAAYAEIAVTRRLSRDGSSDYAINKTPVRLMDVTNLFLGTGAGTKAYSIVEQGRVGLIVTSKPEDRRMLFEEAAGITRFKARKKLAEKKIELTRQNLLRVSDILAEIEKGLVSLKRQAQKAERYKQLRGEQRALDLYIASHRYLELAKVGAETRTQLEHALARLEGVEAALVHVEADGETQRRALFALESALEQAQNLAFAADNEARRLEAELQRTRDQLVNARRRLTDAGRELAEVNASATTLLGERDALIAELERVANEEAEEIERLAIAEDRLREVRENLQEMEGELRAHREASLSAEKALATAEATRVGVGRRLRELDERTARARTESRSIERRLAEIQVERGSAQGQLERLRAERDALQARRHVLEAEQGPMREALSRTDQSLGETRRERERHAARLQALREVARRHEGVGQGVRALLDGRDPAVKGLVADRLAVADTWARPVAAVLADRWQDVLVGDLDAGVRLLEKLRADKRGRATVVAAVQAGEATALARAEAPPPEGEGVVGLLYELAGGDASIDPFFAESLAAVVLVETLSDAVRCWRAQGEGGRWRFVTRAGEVVDPSGRITGGVPEAAGAGLLATQAEIRALEPRVEALDERVAALSDELVMWRERVKSAADELESLKADLHAQELALVTVERDAKAQEAEVAQGTLRLQGLSRELEEATRKVEEAMVEDEGLDRAITEARTKRDRAREGMMAGEAEGQAWKAEVDRATSRVTDAKVVAARARERATAARNAVHRLERSVEELKVRGDRLEAELAELSGRETQSAAREDTLRAQLGEAVAAAQERQQTVAERRVGFEGLRNGVAEIDAQLRTIRGQKEQLGKHVSQLEMKAREEALAMEHLVATVADRYQLALPSVVPEHQDAAPPGPEERARQEELARTIERLGEVNLGAIDEYAEQERRRSFFAGQKADIERGLEQLEAAIAQMNRESRRRFRETFDAVNEHFQALFPRLFRGGKGMLQLTGADDLLEAGVEIIAQPPGKKLVNLEAMSGGEKTMTAVTLLFALFMFKPSPFCLLDEVEAALDEANVIRLVDLVRELTDRSQFIMITHNKRTMAMADVMYGVTMQEPGVSKLVSVKVHRDAPSERTAVA